MKLSYGGKEVIFWISNKGNLVQHLKIIQKNDRLLTAIIKRPINDGATVLALDAETGLMNITVTTLNKGEGPGDPDWLVTDVSTYKCQ